MTTPKAISDYLATIGAKGGASGTGESKKRGNSEHYKAMSEKAAAARAAKQKAQASTSTKKRPSSSR